MIEESIYSQYGIIVEREAKGLRYPAFRSGDTLFCIIPLPEDYNRDELAERQLMSAHLIQQGDRHVSEFVMASHGSYISETEGALFLLLANRGGLEGRSEYMGRKLAKFHARARTIGSPIKVCSRIGMWKGMWERRIDQLERVWNEKLMSHPNNSFEESFVDSFPYYMAIAENAIQYLGDTEMDDQPDFMDEGTVCYDRFSNETWTGNPCIKNPFDWVFDHGTRDMAEWIRQHYFANLQTHQPGIAEFMAEYQSYGALNGFSARLLFARLMFPIHYVETVEEYFAKPKEAKAFELEDSLHSFEAGSHYYEEFLRHFYDLARIPARQLSLPGVTWL